MKLLQVFPGSPTQCERALFKAVKSGELDTVEKLIRFYKCDPSFVNATYRDTGLLVESFDLNVLCYIRCSRHTLSLI